MRDFGNHQQETRAEVEYRRVTSLADRAAVIRLRVDIVDRTRNVYGGVSSTLPTATVTAGTFGAFTADRAIAAVDTHWTAERPLPPELAEALGLSPVEVAKRPLAVLERVHLHPDHRVRQPVEPLLKVVVDEARAKGITRIYGISDLTSLPAFRGAGFRPEGPLRTGNEDNELYIAVADLVPLAAPAPRPVAEPAAHVAPPNASRTGPSRGIFTEGLLAQLEPALGRRSYFRVIPGGRLPRSGRTGTLAILVVAGSVEVTDDGRHVDTLRTGDAEVEAVASPSRTWVAGPGGAIAIVLDADELRDVVVRHPELGGEIAVALMRGVAG